MNCLSDNGNGTYSISNPQPTELTNCVFVIAQPNELPTAFMNMTPEEGLQVGGLLALVLVAGFSFRAMAQALNINDRNDNE